MTWTAIYTALKNGSAQFARRESWGEGYLIWLKDEVYIKESWCKDEKLKYIISKYGILGEHGEKQLKGTAFLQILTPYGVVRPYEIYPEDRVADDWITINI